MITMTYYVYDVSGQQLDLVEMLFNCVSPF